MMVQGKRGLVSSFQARTNANSRAVSVGISRELDIGVK